MKTPHPQKKTDPPRALRGLLPILVVIGLVVLTISSSLVLRTPENSQAVNNAPAPSVTFTAGPRGIAPSPAQPSSQAIKSALAPYVLPTSAVGGIASGVATVIPYVPPTPYVTFTPGPGGRIAPGGIPVTPTAGPSPLPPAPTLAATGKKPLACTFPLAQTTSADSAPETYTFSDPKLAPLNSSWSEITLYQWLPDNQRVLIAHSDEAQMSELRETIGLLNPQTGESQDFGSRSKPGQPPVWIPGLKAVVYPEFVDLTPATFSNNGQGPVIPLRSADLQRQLWFSRGDAAHPRTLINDRVTVTRDRPSQFGWDFTVAASPDGGEIVYLDSVGRQLYKQQVVQGAFQSVPAPAFDATQWLYRPPDDASLQTGWHMTWRPNSTQVFLYSHRDRSGASYTFLLDTRSGAVCELNLWTDDPRVRGQSWAGQAHWSPNGRYLAVARAKGSPPIDSSDLIVLDTATGKLYQIEPAQLRTAGVEQEGQQFIVDVAWAPDNRHLAAIGRVDHGPSSLGGEWQSASRLFLVDFLTGQAVQISTAEVGIWNWPNDDLLWSSDGSQLFVTGSRGYYLLSVQKRLQP